MPWPARTVQRRGLAAPQLVGLPERRDLADQLLDGAVALLLRQVLAVVAGQQLRDARVLVLQRAAVDLRGVRRQHNLHVLLHDCGGGQGVGGGGAQGRAQGDKDQ